MSVVIAMLIVVLCVADIPMSASASASNCQMLTIPVAPGPGLPNSEYIAGMLCLPAVFAKNTRQLDILVHGATYDRNYWDFPVQYPNYSYVQRTLQAGRATFAYDRLAIGQSSRPLSATITIGSDAYALHQIVQEMRQHYNMQQVDVVGHSYGSMISVQEAATYHDADRVVLTGLLHSQGPGELNGLTALYPAMLDPQFASKGYDPGYLTTRPGVRGTLFYYLPTTNPTVLAYDEAHKSVISSTQFADGQTESAVPAGINLSNQINVPVLVIAGQYDALFCGLTLDCNNAAAVRANETPYYTGSPSLTTSIVSNTGHDLVLHTTAGTSFNTINQWIVTH